MRKNDWLFVGAAVVSMLVAVPPVLELLRSTRHSEYYSHIPLIVLVSAYLLFRRRKLAFKRDAAFSCLGSLLVLSGLGLFLAGKITDIASSHRATFAAAAALAFLGGAYLLLYGNGGGHRARFPLAFLLFAIPIPIPIMESLIRILVVGSTEVTRWLFTAFRVPLFQEGAVFFLPGFSIEVAQECSGIRSSLALLITTVLAGHIFLGRFWKQILLAMVVFPVAIIKNAVRILTLYLLSYFVDIRIIEGGFLHKSGGFIFFGIGLFLIGFALWLLRDEATN